MVAVRSFLPRIAWTFSLAAACLMGGCGSAPAGRGAGTSLTVDGQVAVRFEFACTAAAKGE